MRVIVDIDKCIGCGTCQEICPAVFHLDETMGKAEVIDSDACEYVGCCEAAEENCPVEAITVGEG
jgi:ferredoxin